MGRGVAGSPPLFMVLHCRAGRPATDLSDTKGRWCAAGGGAGAVGTAAHGTQWDLSAVASSNPPRPAPPRSALPGPTRLMPAGLHFSLRETGSWLAGLSKRRPEVAPRLWVGRRARPARLQGGSGVRRQADRGDRTSIRPPCGAAGLRAGLRHGEGLLMLLQCRQGGGAYPQKGPICFEVQVTPQLYVRWDTLGSGI